MNSGKHGNPGYPSTVFAVYQKSTSTKIAGGWTILRTSYDDDEEFTQAVAAIQRLALVRLEDEYRESRTRGKPAG